MSGLIDIKVPDIGDFKDVPVIEVFVKPGDVVKAEDSLVTLESDKATMDVPAPGAGTVKELKVKEFRLEGTKALLKEHDGHQDEFTGVVYVPRDKDVNVKGKQVGKRTRITTTQGGGNPDPRRTGDARVADRETTTESQSKLEARQWLRMKVTSVKHVSTKCSVTAQGGLFNGRPN